MKVFKPRNPKFRTEFFANIILTVIVVVLFILNSLKIDIIKQTVNTRILFGILLAAVFAYLVFKIIIALFYKITISDSFVSFYYPIFSYNKKIPFDSITKVYMQNKTIIIFLKSHEVVKIGLAKYSKEQHKELLFEIEDKSKIKTSN